MKLSDLIDVDRLQILIQHLFYANGIPTSIHELNGDKIISTDWRDVCKNFHRVNGITCQRCIENDRDLNKIINDTQKYAISKCRNGLIDIGAPILINGEHVASIFQGQFFFEEPDIDYFKKQAFLANFDEEKYIKAIKETPVISPHQMKELINFLTEFSTFIADLGLAHYETKKANIELYEQHQEISAMHEELVATEEELRRHNELITHKNQALEDATEKYKLVAEGSSNVIWDMHIDEGTLSLSKGFNAMIGYKDIEVDTLNKLLSFVHTEDVEQTRYKYTTALESLDIFDHQFRMITAEGDVKWVHFRAKIKRDKDNKPTRIAGSIHDITEHMTYQNYIQRMAYIDNLTGINNRNQMLIHLEDSFSYLKEHHNKKLSVILLNLDNYKDINDLYGHHLGDQILTSIALRLNSISDDRLGVYRYGGDEFVLIMKEDHREVIKKTAEKLLELFHIPITLHKKNYNLSASIGISIFPEGGTDVDRILLNAVTALKDAKSKGKNRITVFTSSMQEELTRIRLFDHALNIAIQNQEFFLVYQPKVDVITNKMKSVEALIRWRSPKEGIISPNEFIPIAEQRGFITKIDLWVLEESIKQAIEWTLCGYRFDYISVNMSPEFLMDPKLLKHVNALLKKYTLNTSKIQIEITENVFIDSFDSAVNVLMRLKELGFSIALDDFGKGYSSLSYLKQLPIDVLKIDKLFIDTMINDDHPIIEFIIAMGQRLKMKIVAEGVEKEEQLALLKTYGCDMYQGYLFSTPLSPLEITTFFSKQKDLN